MKNLIVSITFVFMTVFSASSSAVFVTCAVGPFMGMTKTAYAKVRTGAFEYPLAGTFYGMAISRDLQNNVAGQTARVFYKPYFSDAFWDVWIVSVSPSNDWRNLTASGGVSPWSGEICAPSTVKHTQILP